MSILRRADGNLECSVVLTDSERILKIIENVVGLSPTTIANCLSASQSSFAQVLVSFQMVIMDAEDALAGVLFSL
jgi:hypothetical protein